ncbi:hypothetical protein TWF506_007999 [Arthrobotrys conoides]|uniref:Uncharacterized protein n=1 Tax=Arthrobotrys conoides TaxID=74498 RepID=A0AAN8RNM2_9PEZI
MIFYIKIYTLINKYNFLKFNILNLIKYYSRNYFSKINSSIKKSLNISIFNT